MTMEAKALELLEDIKKEHHDFVQENDARIKLIEKKGHDQGEILEKTLKMSEAIGSIEDTIQELQKTAERVKEIETSLERQQKELKDKGEFEDPAVIEYKTGLLEAFRTGQHQAFGLQAKSYAEKVENLREKAMIASSSPDGGLFLTTAMESGIHRFIVDTSPMRSVARVQTGSDHSRKGRFRASRFTNGGWVGEQQSRPTTGTGTFGEWEIVANEQYAYPEISQIALEDADFGLESWLLEELGLEFMYTENTAFVNGNGVAKPRGFLTYTAGTTYTDWEIEQINLGAAAALTADGFVNLQDSLHDSLQSGAAWAMRTSTRTATRLLKDGQGNYLLIPDYSAAGASRLLGKAIAVMEDMPAVGANALAVAYGNWRQGYMVYDRRGVSVLRDPYTNKGFVGFYATKRTGGGVTNPEAIKIGKIAV